MSQQESKKVLIVEDDRDVAEGISFLLSQQGYFTQVALSGERALNFLDWYPDCVILDLCLPDVNGYELCQQIRQKFSDIVILVLSAKSESWEKVNALHCGANAYLTKPYEPSLLLAQLKALWQLSGFKKADLMEKPNFLIWDEQKHCFTLFGNDLQLTTTEAKVLQYLVSYSNRVVSRQELLWKVWGYGGDMDSRVVDVTIQRLRKKLGKYISYNCIETVRGIGYRLVWNYLRG